MLHTLRLFFCLSNLLHSLKLNVGPHGCLPRSRYPCAFTLFFKWKLWILHQWRRCMNGFFTRNGGERSDGGRWNRRRHCFWLCIVNGSIDHGNEIIGPNGCRKRTVWNRLAFAQSKLFQSFFPVSQPTKNCIPKGFLLLNCSIQSALNHVGKLVLLALGPHVFSAVSWY